MAVNLRANGVYLVGETVRIPPRKSTGKTVWGDVLERNGAVVLVEVRQTVARGRLRVWTETYTVDELDDTARRFTAALRRASA